MFFVFGRKEKSSKFIEAESRQQGKYPLFFCLDGVDLDTLRKILTSNF